MKTVLKFGGTSVSTLKCWQTILGIVQEKQQTNQQLIIVCSALSGVSNLLEKIGSNPPEQRELLNEVFDRYLNFIRELGLDRSLIRQEIHGLKRLSLGIALLGHGDARTRAELLSYGELMLTKVAHSWLEKQGLDCLLLDARKVLLSSATQRLDQDYLNSDVKVESGGLLSSYGQHSLILTQGFIAGNSSGETVLLGRGGSDTSAAYFAVMFAVDEFEIWTDVPGMFTANPQKIGSARLIQNLHYSEAQELASCGAKILHPKAIAPAQQHQIPLTIKCTHKPELLGTRIDKQNLSHEPKVKAIITKRDIVVISMESLGMWQEIGFLADVFSCFKVHGFSIDHVATSQTNITVTLDQATQQISRIALERLFLALKKFCIPKEVGPCAAISLVGRNLRSLFHQLGPGLSAFEECRIYLLSQAASDLNFSFIVAEKDLEKLESQLHKVFFDSDDYLGDYFGPSWRQINGENLERKSLKNSFWEKKRSQLLELGKRSPLYVYDKDTILARAKELKALKGIERFNYAMKANSHPEILRLLFSEGFSFDCVSWAEVERLVEVIPDFDLNRVVFTPNFAHISEYQEAMAHGVLITVDNVQLLADYPEVFSGQKLMLRFDPGQGFGHHKHVRTAGEHSKFGISMTSLDWVLDLVESLDIQVVGLHTHLGSGIKDPLAWPNAAFILAELVRKFPKVSILDLGGGLGVPERPGQASLDLIELDNNLCQFKQSYPNLQLWMEPGRFLVAESGVLLSQVSQIKKKGKKLFVGLNTGMNSLIRHPLYGSYHEVINLSKLEEPLNHVADIVGPICESGDVFGNQRLIPETHNNDIFLIANAGAYGACMASKYNLREPAKEILI